MFNISKSTKKNGNKKTVIVTGGAGFIGSHLTKSLLAENFNVHVIDNLSSGKRGNVPDEAVFHLCDIRHPHDLRKVFKKIGTIDCVFHLAAVPEIEISQKNPFKTNETNVVGTDYVLGASYEFGVKKVIYSSSCSIYGNQTVLPIHETATPSPMSPYAFHKQIGELYCALYSQSCNLPTVSLRYFNVYGPNQSFKNAYSGAISVFLNQIKTNQPLTITGDGTQTRDFVHVFDVVRANIMAMQSDKVGHGETINIGSGRECTIDTVATIFGGEKKYMPAREEIKGSRADILMAKKLLGWVPTVTLEEGITALLQNNSSIS